MIHRGHNGDQPPPTLNFPKDAEIFKSVELTILGKITIVVSFQNMFRQTAVIFSSAITMTFSIGVINTSIKTGCFNNKHRMTRPQDCKDYRIGH